MNQFMSDYKPCEIIDMNKNYRSSECIIEAADKIIRINKSRIFKSQIACKDDKEDGSIVINICNNAVSEADFVCKKIKELANDDYDMTNVAIIFRTFSCINILQEKFNICGIPYSIRNTADNYYDNEYIKDIVIYLRIALGISDVKQEIRVLNRPERNLSIDMIADNNGLHNAKETKYKTLLEKIKLISNMNCYAAVTFILKGLEYETYLRANMIQKGYSDEKIEEFITELLDKARIYSSIREWILYIDLVTNNNSDTQNINDKKQDEVCTINNGYNGKINLITAHSSKGLEYETVFIVGLQEGIFPSNKVKNDEQMEEERRLMYVAMTRAKKYLYVIGRGEERYGKKVSRFVTELLENTW